MAVIIDHTNRRVLEVLENRDQKTVTDFLQKAHQSGLLKQVTEVTTDMWDGYVNAAQAAFGENVSVVVDRFHVVKNLSTEERAELQTLRAKFPQLARLADQRESLRTLFEDRSITTSEMAQERLKEWLTAARSLQLKPLDAFCQTVENWLPMIANYFTNRSSNGPTEGFNRHSRECQLKSRRFHPLGEPTMIHVIATIELNPGTRDAFLGEFRKIVAPVRAEAGCIEYGPTVDAVSGLPVQGPVRADVVTVVERWESLEHLQAHLVAPHMLEYRPKVKDFVRLVKLQILEPV